MTFLNEEEQRGGLSPQQDTPAEAPAPLWKELFNASLETSSVGSLAEQSALGWQRSLPSTQQQADPDYDPFDDVQGYEQFADAFASSQSRYESDLIKRSIDKRLENQETVARGGLAGLATTLATEPLNFVPLGPVASITGRIGNNLGRFAATGAATGAVGAGLVEGALQATDPTRTAEQSVMNLALSTTLGTAIGTAGAGVATFLAGRAGKAGTEFEAFRGLAERALIGENLAPSGSTGAMASRNTTLEQEGIKKGLGANYLNKLNESEAIVGNPVARTRASENLLVRQLSGELAETPYITEGNTVGIASPQAVETQIKRWQAPLAQALQDLDNQFALYRLGRAKKFGDLAKIGALDTYTQATRRTPEKLTYGQFKDEVAKSMRRGDQSDNPNVAAAARSMREKVFDPLKERAIEAGLLPKDVTVETAISYLTRVYDTGKIIKQRPEFETRITNWLKNVQEDVKRQIAAGVPIADQNNIIKDFVPASANQPDLARVPTDAPAGAQANAVRILSQDTAVTPTGRRVPVDYALVDAKTLVTSNTDDLKPNPAYPQELQPRDRTRGTTELQIKNITNPDSFRPELLGKTPDAATGAPIVSADMVVQSGNARSIALRRAYGENGATAQAYRDYLTAQGFDLTGIDQPVLVRINRSNMTTEQLQAFTREANTSSILAMSSTERAAADARALPDGVLDLAVDGDLTSAITARPEIGQLAPDQQGVLAALYKQAEEAKPEFDAIATGIVKDLDAMGIKAEVKLAKLKGADRAIEKILTEKDGAVTSIKDLVRATIIVDNLEDAAPAFDLVKQRYALAGKQRYLLEENSPSLEGYRDAFTNVNVNGHIAEMQVSVRKIADLKESTNPRYYQPIRKLRAKEKAGVVTEEELDLLNQLEANQIQEFETVWSEVLADRSARMASNSASDMRGALATRAIDDGKTGNVDPSGLNPNKVMGSTDVSNLTGTPSKLKNLDISSPPNEKVAQPGGNVKPTAQAIRPEYVTFSQLEEGDLRAIAQEITDKIVGGAPGRSNYEPIPLTRGPLRERTLSIPDEQIEDFLENDIERVARIYTRTMSTDVELATKFGRADMQDQLMQVNDTYAILRADAERTLKGKKLEARMEKLEKARKNDLGDLEGMRDRIRGTYAIPSDPNSMIVRTGRAARTLNYVRLLGGMTLSAIPDIANPINRHGFGRVFGTLGALQNKQLFNLAAEEVKAAGTALDMVLDSRAMQMADIWDDYGRSSTFERGLQAVQDRFGVVSLMAPWNAAMKQFAGVMSQTRLLQEARKLAKGKIGKVERERLAFLGIDQQMAQRIAEQADNWKEDSGIIWANTSAWADREAVDAFRNAIVKEVDNTIVTPGQDRPLWMSTEMGKVIGQFKSFAFTSLSKVAVSSLQRGDKNVMQGLVVAVALGMMVHGIKQTQSGRPMPEKPQDWIVSGLDRSGVMGWLFEANNMVEKATAGNVGLNPALGTTKGQNRFASRGVVGSFMGPSFGLAEDLVAVTGAAASGELDRNELEKLRRMVPYQNVPYLAWMFDQIENGAGNAMGLQPK